MHDAFEAAGRIESGVLRELERLYPAAVSPLMKKHQETLKKLDKLEHDGAYGRARVLIRKSGLLNDVAKALAYAGKEAAAVIRAEISGVQEVAHESQETG